MTGARCSASWGKVSSRVCSQWGLEWRVFRVWATEWARLRVRRWREGFEGGLSGFLMRGSRVLDMKRKAKVKVKGKERS